MKEELSRKFRDSANLMYLTDVVKPGDIVNYDAGNWTETKAKPTHQGDFGGYKAGTNKGMSLEGCKHGWRVLSSDYITVKLVHAGIPEYYDHSKGQNKESLDKLKERAIKEFLNNEFAIDAHMLTLEEIEKFGTESDLRTIYYRYYLATAFDYYNYLWGVNTYGDFTSKSTYAFGDRPVVELKPNILTPGKGIDCVGNKNAWQLVKK